MKDCLFCQIIDQKIPSEIIYEDEFILGFKDIFPQAKEHYLFIHKEHSQDILDMDITHIGKIFKAIKIFQQGVEGFRIVTNCGKLSGQSVFHTHFHLLRGEALGPFGAGH